jgi:hypothetical protein
MTLSTQLTRGTLALPMLALFGALALATGPAAEAQGYAAPESVVVRDIEAGACAVIPRPALVLSLAPADLGPMAQRPLRIVLAAGCRA